MKEPEGRDLERELWAVYDSVADAEDVLQRASVQMKALEILAKIRKEGEKVRLPATTEATDPSLAKARARANGTHS